MTLVTLKCDSAHWANYFTQGQKGPLHAGFQTGNLLQLTFPTQKPYTLKDHSAFAFALYLTSVSHPGRTTEEPNSAFSDRSAAHVTRYPVYCFPFSCAITCLPPKLTPKEIQLAISNSITCWIQMIPPLWTYQSCRPWCWINLSLCQYRPFALSSKLLLAFPSIASPKHSAGPPWTWKNT